MKKEINRNKLFYKKYKTEVVTGKQKISPNSISKYIDELNSKYKVFGDIAISILLNLYDKLNEYTDWENYNNSKLFLQKFNNEITTIINNKFESNQNFSLTSDDTDSIISKIDNIINTHISISNTNAPIKPASVVENNIPTDSNIINYISTNKTYILQYIKTTILSILEESNYFINQQNDQFTNKSDNLHKSNQSINILNTDNDENNNLTEDNNKDDNIEIQTYARSFTKNIYSKHSQYFTEYLQIISPLSKTIYNINKNISKLKIKSSTVTIINNKNHNKNLDKIIKKVNNLTNETLRKNKFNFNKFLNKQISNITTKNINLYKSAFSRLNKYIRKGGKKENFIQSIKNNILNFVEKIKEITTQIAEGIKKIKNKIQEMVEGVVDVIGNIFDILGNVLFGILGGIFSILSFAVTSLFKIAKSIITIIGKLLSVATNFLVAKIQKLFSKDFWEKGFGKYILIAFATNRKLLFWTVAFTTSLAKFVYNKIVSVIETVRDTIDLIGSTVNLSNSDFESNLTKDEKFYWDLLHTRMESEYNGPLTEAEKARLDCAFAIQKAIAGVLGVFGINPKEIPNLDITIFETFNNLAHTFKTIKNVMISNAVTTGFAAAGAGLGAIIGSIFPGVGTALGATVGLALGGIVGALFNKLNEPIDDTVNASIDLNAIASNTFQKNSNTMMPTNAISNINTAVKSVITRNDTNSGRSGQLKADNDLNAIVIDSLKNRKSFMDTTNEMLDHFAKYAAKDMAGNYHYGGTLANDEAAFENGATHGHKWQITAMRHEFDRFANVANDKMLLFKSKKFDEEVFNAIVKAGELDGKHMTGELGEKDVETVKKVRQAQFLAAQLFAIYSEFILKRYAETITAGAKDSHNQIINKLVSVQINKCIEDVHKLLRDPYFIYQIAIKKPGILRYLFFEEDSIADSNDFNRLIEDGWNDNDIDTNMEDFVENLKKSDKSIAQLIERHEAAKDWYTKPDIFKIVDYSSEKNSLSDAENFDILLTLQQMTNKEILNHFESKEYKINDALNEFIKRQTDFSNLLNSDINTVEAIKENQYGYYNEIYAQLEQILSENNNGNIDTDPTVIKLKRLFSSELIEEMIKQLKSGKPHKSILTSDPENLAFGTNVAALLEINANTNESSDNYDSDIIESKKENPNGY